MNFTLSSMCRPVTSLHKVNRLELNLKSISVCFLAGPHSEQKWGCCSFCGIWLSSLNQRLRHPKPASSAPPTELQVRTVPFWSDALFNSSVHAPVLLPPLVSPPTLENDDISVSCGTQYMDLSIFICPMYQAFYNESMMVVNNQGNKAECYGMADWTVDPPVLKFRFPLNESSISACNNNFKVFFFGCCCCFTKAPLHVKVI